ncbi:MAG TPA: DUF3494 domain-containing protein [Verrucomicrobia bacterium]|nr:DUF3494 domain-containing protein [Verrucomicrobiota bacterium]
MKTKMQILLSLVLAAGATWIPPVQAAGPAPIDLGSCAHFTILAGSAITQPTAGGVINGDIGLSPASGASIGIPPEQVNGTIYAVDATGTQAPNVVIDPALLTAAKGDLTIAYNDAAGRTPVPTGDFLNPNGGNIGGLNLVPGLYKFTGTALITGSDVTLTGGPDDVWIFQIAADLQVGSGVAVILAGGAQARNIFWQVGTSATLDTGSSFKGTILADQSITMNTTSTVEGRALAFTGQVAFSGDGGSLPQPAVPRFTAITHLPPHSASVVLDTTPHFQLTLQASPAMAPTNWTTIAEATPVSTPWSFTNDTVTSGVTTRFYRAFLTQP